MPRETPLRTERSLLRKSKKLHTFAKRSYFFFARLAHRIADHFPSLIRPVPRQVTIAVTAACNLRCQGCRYGRDFMTGSHLQLGTILQALNDCRDSGVKTVRFYGGEPLIHRDLPAMIGHAAALGMRPYITTNGILLERSVEALFAAGLRLITIGFYGVDRAYDDYTQREGSFARLRRSLAQVRAVCGRSMEVQINYVLMRHSCTVEALTDALALAREFDLFIHFDLVSYSAPFFKNAGLGFSELDSTALDSFMVELLKVHRAEPQRFPHSREFLRSIPDWLLKKAAMRVPCDAYELVWIGADGSVQLCDVAFPLGNINERRLQDILNTDAHRRAARDAFQLKCPNCMCKIDTRIQKHGPSMRAYGQRGRWE